LSIEGKKSSLVMIWIRKSVLCVVWAASAAHLAGCRSGVSAAETATLEPSADRMETAGADLDVPAPIPSGTWRAAPPEELDRTMLWLSHILIRHVDVSMGQVSFNVTGWQSSEAPSGRPRVEALQLATHLAETARRQGNFDALARQHSEDPATRVQGGSLGGVVAGHFYSWPQVLDAIAPLEPGGTSPVVETEYGYHVFQRRAPAPDVTVSGAHIVIAHDQAPWVQFAARGPVRSRSREEAFAIAARVFELARVERADFAQLAEKYSEHQDAVRGGDFGTWSTRELSGYPREIETLASLQVGEVAEPLDTMFGVQIIQRLPNQPRREYAMSQVQLRFDPSKPDPDPASRSSALQLAQSLTVALQKDPAAFLPLQEKYCCSSPRRVIEGREAPALEALLARLAPGQIGKEPVEEVAFAYVLAKRLDPSVLSDRSAPHLHLP
jgi:hypothetical protein